MAPTLRAGEFVLTQPRRNQSPTPQPGDVVVIQHPYEQRLIIKRIETIQDGAVTLRGDNPASSTDSRAFGQVSVGKIVGRVMCVLRG